jgi:hypothetical protein
MKLEDFLTQEDSDGFELVYRDYIFHQEGHHIVVERVPYLRDPVTDALYLHASVAERLWQLTHNETVPKRQVLTDFVSFSESDYTHA